MARELYNWDQVRGYSIVALYNVLNKDKDVNLKNYIDELNPLQTQYGKDGIVGISKRYLNSKG